VLTPPAEGEAGLDADFADDDDPPSTRRWFT